MIRLNLDIILLILGTMSHHDNPDDKKISGNYSPLAKGYLLGTLVLTAAIESVIPMVVGTWVDKRLQTAPLFVLLGIGLGILILVAQLLRIVKKV